MYIERMLSFIPGIGEKTEKRLRGQGIQCWDDLLNSKNIPSLNPTRLTQITNALKTFKSQLETDPVSFVESNLKHKDKFILFHDFQDSVAYFDIETTGLTPGRDYTTTIAVWDGKTCKTFVKGENIEEFQSYISKYKLLVTFFGAGFDIPFLKRDLGIDFSNHLHIDLCFVLRSLGITGGLKAIEKRFKINRGNLTDIDGSCAVKLWYLYKRQMNRKYLDTLLAYNVEDVVNLETLMIHAWNLAKDRYELDLPKIEAKERNYLNPFHVDSSVIKEVLF